MSADSHQSVVMPFSPQFEDISDAEDDVRPTTVNQRDSVCTSPAYSLPPPPASQCLPQLSTGLYPSPVGSMFCTTASITVAASHPSIVGWNSYSGFPSQTTMMLPGPMASVGQPSNRILPWVAENRTQMGAVNRLSSVMNSTGSSGHILPADVLHMNVSSTQPFLGNRFAGSDGIGCLKSELSPVKSEVLQTDKSYGHQMSFKLENCNGHVGDVKSEPYIKAEFPNSHAETSREPCSSTLESRVSCFAASQPKSEETVLSNSDTSVGSHHIAEDAKTNIKTDTRDSEPSFHNRLLIKPEIGNTSPPRYSPCLHSSATSVSPSLQTSYFEPDSTAVGSLTPSAQATADVTQVPNNLEPKVPPLRIIIPSKVCSSGSLSDGSNTNTLSRCGVGSLPYVVSRTHSTDNDVVNNAADEVRRSDSSPAAFPSSSDSDRLSTAKDASAGSELVPAKRRKIKHSSKVRVRGHRELIVVIIC